MKWTKTAAFEFFGTKCDNTMWGWSGVAKDGSVVALTLWSDIRDGDRYEDFGRRDTAWQHKLGNRSRRKHIAHALAKHGGRFRPVHIVADKAVVGTRSIKRCEPRDEWWTIDRFDEVTGEFSAHRVAE